MLSACFYVYGLGLLAYGLLRFITGGTHNVVRILDTFMPTLLLPALLLLPLSLLTRRLRAALLFLPVVIFLIVFYGGLFIPRAAAQIKPDLTILTYNILGGNHNFDAIAQTIHDANADVVVLQELSTDLATGLPMTHLASDYAYSSLHPYTVEVSRLGLGIYSRYPLLVDDYSVFQQESSRVRFQIEVKGVPVTIYDVHLTNPLVFKSGFGPQAHADAIDKLVDMLESETGPLIVAGDFNMTDISLDYGRMTSRLLDSFRESGSGLGFTFPSWSPLPLARLDYVFHSSDIRSLSTQVLSETGGSDHFPVRAELMLPTASATETP